MMPRSVLPPPVWVAAWMGLAALYIVGHRGRGRLRALASGSTSAAMLSLVANALSAGAVWLLLACAVFVQYFRATTVRRARLRAAGPR